MSAKSLSFAAELRDDLARRFATVSSVGFDASANPTILIGAGTAGSQSAFIRVIDFQPLGVDGIGLAQRAYGTPLVVQVVLETSTIANVSLLTGANILPLLAELGVRGARVELYMSANTNAPEVSDIITANLRATFDPDMKNKLQSQI